MKKIFLIAAGALFLLAGQACDSEEFVSAKMWVQNADLDKAEEFFIKAMEVEPENAEIPMRLASDVYAPQRRWAELNDALEEAVRRNPMQMMRGNTIKDLALNIRQVNWSRQYSRAANLYNSILEQTDGATPNDEQSASFRQVVDMFNEAIIIYPEETATYQPLVFTYRQLNDLEGERQAISKALARDPDNGIVLLLAGQNAYNESHYDDAIALLEHASKSMPGNMDVLNMLTTVYLETGDSKGALATLERVRQNVPQDSDVFYNMAAVYTNVGNELLNIGQELYRNAVAQAEVPIEPMKQALVKFGEAQEAYSEALYFMDNVMALNPEDEDADQAIRDIQTRKKRLDMLQRSAEEMVK